MIYAVNKRTKNHHVPEFGRVWDKSEWTLVQADADGWIEWHGGECPLPEGVKHEVKLRSGSTFRVGCPSVWRWKHCSDRHDREDIIAYRPILDEPRQATLAGAKLWQDAEGTIPACEGDPVGRVGEPPAWDGEGNPPIGMPVKVRTKECDSAAVVLANDHNIVVVRYESALGFKYGGFNRLDVRPIRSEEDVAVKEMAMIIGRTAAGGSRCAARALYRAGYRKVSND